MGDFSTFLLGKPSPIEGASRILDFAGALNQYNTTAIGQEADQRALEADWRAVGKDIEEAIHHEADPPEKS